MTKKETAINLIKTNNLILILIGIFIIGIFTSEHFLTMANMRIIFLSVSMIGILAVGETVVMLLGELDLSIAALMGFCPVVAINIVDKIKARSGAGFVEAGNYVNSGLFSIIILTVLLGFTIGAINGLIVVKARVPSLIATLGMMYSLTGFAYIISNGTPYYLKGINGFNWLGNATFFQIPVSFLLYILLGITTLFVLKFTKIGKRIYATGGNEKAAIYSGINTGSWKIAAFVFSGLCASIASLIYSSRLESATAAQGAGLEVIAITVVVIGGTTLQGGKGGISGTIIASLILQIFLNIIVSLGVVSWYETLIIGVLIIGVIYINSRMESNRNKI